MDEQIEKLTARVAAQDERIATLERQLGRSSRNSSQPPSADRPSVPPRRGKDPSGRKQGGQPGHEGKGATLLLWGNAVTAAQRMRSRARPSACEGRVRLGTPARRARGR
jgi:transposase